LILEFYGIRFHKILDLSVVSSKNSDIRIMIIQKIAHYLNPMTWFKKSKHDTNLKFMHGINRISLVMFLLALGVMVFRYLSR